MSFECMAWAIKKKTGSAAAKAVLMHLANCTNHQTGICRPRIKVIAEECEISESTTKTCLKRLEEIGLITVIPRFKEGVQLANDYLLNLDGVGQNLTQGGSKSDPGVGQNLTPVETGRSETGIETGRSRSAHANEPQQLPQTFDPPTPLPEPAQTSGPAADPSTSTASPTTPGEPATTKRTRRKTAPSPSSAPPPPSLADNPPSLQEWVEYMKEREPLVPAMRAEFYYGKWTANGWCRQDGTPYRNWKGLAIQSIAFWKDSFGREYLELKREAQTAARAPEPDRTYAPDDWDSTK